MKGQSSSQMGFDDALLEQRSANCVLEQMDALAPWAQIDALLDEAYPARTGRPSHPPRVLFKMLVLQHLYALSDPQCEQQVRDRLSFMRFVGLGLSDAVPDETALVRFRQRLREAGLDERLLQLLNARLLQQGLVLRRGTLIDASFVAAASSQDPQARDLGGARHEGKRGYKLHVGVDQDSGLVRGVRITQANVHDGTVGAQLICGDQARVLADRAYDRKDLRAQLAAAGIADGLMRKAHAGLIDATKAAIAQRNRSLAPVRAAVERIFADWKCRRSLRAGRARYQGLAANGQHFTLLAFTHNLRRWAVLTG